MSKGPHPLVRLIIYPILAICFLIVCYYIALSASGYTLQYKDGQIIKTPTGVIVVATKPGDAAVFIDGKQQKRNTPLFSFLTMTSKGVSIGTHTLKIQKDGYEPWEAKILVEPRLVSWADYVILVPQKREASSFDLPGTIMGMITNEDKSKMVAMTESAETGYRTFWEINLQTKEKRKIREEKLVIDEKVNLLYYNNDATRILVRKVLGEKKSLIIIDSKTAGEIWDISALYRFEFDAIRFSPTDRGILYATKSGDLYSLDYEQKRMSAVLTSGVLGLYTNTSDTFVIKKTEGNVGLWTLASNQVLTSTVKVLPLSEGYQIRHIKEPNGFLVLSQKDKELLLYQNDDNGNPISKSVARNVDYFVVSPKDERVLLVGENGVRVYCFEKKKYHDVLVGKKPENITWFNDSSSLIYSLEGKMYLITYKGEYNKYLFDNIKNTQTFTPYSSPNLYFLQAINGITDLKVFSFNF